jgi:endonuclease YncB( thermonuclease family)
MIRVIFLLAVCLTSLCAPAHATGLYGRVIEVNDGDTITIFNLNKPVIVRLIGVAAPEQQQRFGDVAKQHLSDLILHRSVSVEYQGLVQNNYLLGTVFYREMDVGAQMIRDGAAWFDPETASRLSESDRKIYTECEQAARAEHRGLWQDPEPVAPWNFKKQQTSPSANAAPTTQPASNVKRKTDLSSEDLLSGIAGSSRGLRSGSAVSVSGESQWRILSPEKEHFSVMVPGTGYETSVELPAGTGVLKANYWVTDYEGASYLMIWARGPNVAYTDSGAIDDMHRGMLSGLNRGLEQRGAGVSFETSQQRSLKVGSVTGVQYNLSASGVSGVMRIFSRRVGEEREMFLLGVLNATEKTPSADRFLSSLSFTTKK